MDGEGSEADEGTEEIQQASAYERYAEGMLKRPEYRRIRIGLGRLNRILALVENSWQRTGRHHSLKELGNLLDRQHEIEKEAENIKDVFLRGYIYERLDVTAAARRSLAEEIRWDIESSKKSSGML